MAHTAALFDANEQVTVAEAVVVAEFVQVALTVPDCAGMVLRISGVGVVVTVKVEPADAPDTTQVVVCDTPVLAPTKDRAVT